MCSEWQISSVNLAGDKKPSAATTTWAWQCSECSEHKCQRRQFWQQGQNLTSGFTEEIKANGMHSREREPLQVSENGISSTRQQTANQKTSIVARGDYVLWRCAGSKITPQNQNCKNDGFRQVTTIARLNTHFTQRIHTNNSKLRISKAFFAQLAIACVSSLSSFGFCFLKSITFAFHYIFVCSHAFYSVSISLDFSAGNGRTGAR